MLPGFEATEVNYLKENDRSMRCRASQSIIWLLSKTPTGWIEPQLTK